MISRIASGAFGLLFMLAGIKFLFLIEDGYTPFYRMTAAVLFAMAALFVWVAIKPPVE